MFQILLIAMVVLSSILLYQIVKLKKLLRKVGRLLRSSLKVDPDNFDVDFDT